MVYNTIKSSNAEFIIFIFKCLSGYNSERKKVISYVNFPLCKKCVIGTVILMKE